jgi:hypothetical protein
MELETGFSARKLADVQRPDAYHLDDGQGEAEYVGTRENTATLVGHT